MQLKFKLTDTATGANVSPSKYVIDPDQDGVLIQVLGGDMLDHDAETSHITVRLFTGLADAAGNEIYEGDIGKDRYGRYFSVFYSAKQACFYAIVAELSNEAIIVPLHTVTMRVIGNRYQPEFKGVFGDDV